MARSTRDRFFDIIPGFVGSSGRPLSLLNTEAIAEQGQLGGISRQKPQEELSWFKIGFGPIFLRDSPEADQTYQLELSPICNLIVYI